MTNDEQQKPLSESQHNNADFTITWTNVSYEVKRSLFSRMTDKTSPTTINVLNNVSGYLRSGETVGLMGASGSGKTVLMECLIGKRTSGLTGSISFQTREEREGKNVDGENINKQQSFDKSSIEKEGKWAKLPVRKKKMKLSYIPQDEKLTEGLTVREAIMFSSRIQNSSQSINEAHVNIPEGLSIHDYLTTKIIERLGLERCANNYCTRCSGGQQKRISMAMELVSIPDVLIFDEPTSGLDSAACLAVVNLLSSIAQGGNISGKQVAILISLHQPTWPVYSALTRVIMLAQESGKVFYEGSPAATHDFLKMIGAPISMEDNVADTLMEASCGCFGPEVLQKSYHLQKMKVSDEVSKNPPTTLKSVSATGSASSFFYKFFLLSVRQIVISLRDLQMMNMRVASSIGQVPLLALIFEDSGEVPSCPPVINSTTKSFLREQADGAGTNMQLPNSFILNIIAENLQKLLDLHTNMDFLFFLMFMDFMVGVAPGIFALPKQYPSMKKEVFNNWYSFGAYYLSVTICEALFAGVFSTLFVIPAFYATQQYDDDFWRLISLVGILYLIALIGQGYSTIIVTPFINNPSSGIYLIIVSGVPLLALSGQFTIMSKLEEYLYYLSILDFFQWGNVGSLVSIYGYERCGKKEALWENFHNMQRRVLNSIKWINQNTSQVWMFVNRSVVAGRDQTDDIVKLSEIVSESLMGDYISSDGTLGSLAMSVKELEDDDLWKSYIYLVVFLLSFRVLGYVIFYSKVKGTS